MIEPLFPVPATEPQGVAKAAIERVAELNDKGLIDGRHAVTAALVTQLATDMSHTHKAYALANLSKALLEALDMLPVEPSDDTTDPMHQVRAYLVELRGESAGWEPR